MKANAILGILVQGTLELARGMGLIIRDHIHRPLYRRYGAKVWWCYIGVIALLYLWKTGALWTIINSILVLAVIVFAFWLVGSAVFRKGRRPRP